MLAGSILADALKNHLEDLGLSAMDKEIQQLSLGAQFISHWFTL